MDDLDAALSRVGHELDLDLSAIQLPARPGKGGELLKRGLNYFHEGLADYLIINPGATLKEIGLYFGYSGAWMCQVIGSDMFQAYLAQRRSEVSSRVAQSLPEKLKDASHLAVERLAEIVTNTSDERVAVDAADKILHRFGYAPNAKQGAQAGTTNIQQNNFYLSRGELAEAREKLIEGHNVKDVQSGAGGEASEVPLLPASVHNSET